MDDDFEAEFRHEQEMAEEQRIAEEQQIAEQAEAMQVEGDEQRPPSPTGSLLSATSSRPAVVRRAARRGSRGKNHAEPNGGRGAPAAGASGSRRRNDDDDDSSFGGSDRGAGPRGRATHQRSNRQDNANLRASMGDAADSVYGSNLLSQGLEIVPGWAPMIMGHGIKAKPPVFATGLPGHWVQYNNSGPFPSGVRCRPARVIDLGFIGAWQQASDAERISDMNSQADQMALARTVASCALMGMLSVGTAKGYLASDNHSELTLAKADANPNKNPDDDSDDDENESQSKLKRKLNGSIKTYTYCPNADHADQNKRSQTAMMFCYVHIAMHDRAGKYVGFKILMLIFDKGFSTDLLVSKVMEENGEIKANGKINSMPEKQRNGRLERQNKLQRAQINDDNLEISAQLQSRRISNNQHWLNFMETVGCQADGCEGRPYYANIKRDTPPGCATNPFTKHKEYGGLHPFGPSVSHNHKRFQEPTADRPGINVSIAGTLDERGLPIDLHPSLMDPRQWYDPDTQDFEPPQHVKDMGWCHMCHDPTITDIFSAPLPQKMHGNVEPDEILLHQFWELYKDSNPILSKAQQKGMTTFEQNRDSVRALFHREDDLDPDQQRLSRAVLETDLLSVDSIDKSAAEEATIERRAYGKTSQRKEGDVWVFSVRQILRDHSLEQEKVHAMVNQYDKLRRAELSNRSYNAQPGSDDVFNAKEETRKRQREHADATTACVKLGLQRFHHAFGRKKARKLIPPGYYDVGYVGLKAAIKESGEIGARLSARNRGHKVNPDDPNAGDGTANVGFAHQQSLVGIDRTPFGHHRSQIMNLLSGTLRIAGGDVKLMLDMHCHAFEPFQEVSYCLLYCGGAGSGKSMRAKRMQQLLPEGWIKGSGSASLKAGMNGGMDYLCGRLVYYDEIPNDFASADNDRIEYWKSITMEQRVLNTRSVKTVGENGVESWTTVVLDSLHYESHLICTNCGPLGIRGDQEPSTNRTALTDRSWAHIVHAAEDEDETGDIEFDMQTCSDDVKQQINRYRVCACLVAYVLIFIKHIPSCRPNLTYANMLCNKWYDILDREYNVPKPSKRKKIKLRMLLELFAAESAVFEKFMLRESGIDFEDMRPDENGNLSPFCIEQLTDVVRSLQRCVDWEVIHNAWSHSLDHSHATSSHRFQMMSELAGIHGSIPDRVSITGTPAKPQAPEPQAQGRAQEQDEPYDEAAINDSEADHAAANRQQPPQPPQFATATEEDEDDALVNAVQDERADPPPEQGSSSAEAVLAMANRPRDGDAAGAPEQQQQAQAQARPLTAAQQASYDGFYQRPSVAAKATNGQSAGTPVLFSRFMKDGLSREEAAAGAKELAERREIRCDFSRRAMQQKNTQEGDSQQQQVAKLLTDTRDKKTKEPLMRLPSTGKCISAERAAAACLPDTQEVMSSGYAEQFVRDVVDSKPSATFENDHILVGHADGTKWEYKVRTTEGMNRPADYDFNWVRLKAFNGAYGAGGVGDGGMKIKSVFSNAAREIKKETMNNNFSLINAKSMTQESIKDTLFQMGQGTADNKMRIPRHASSHARERLNKRSNMLAGCQEIQDASKPPDRVHPHCMYDPDFQEAKGYDKRLGYLVDKRALPSCILPESFEKGVPIAECEGGTGVYFNKYVASEHAALKVESAQYLSTVPGIAGGDFADGPNSFKADNIFLRPEQGDTVHDAARKEVEAKRKASASEAGSDAAEGKRRRKAPAPEPMDVEGFAAEDSDGEFAEGSGTGSEAGDTPELRADTSSSDLSSARQGVEVPDGNDNGVVPTAGAYDRVAGASAAPSLKQHSLPDLWDQGAIFYSLKMAETLHNDCEAYVDAVRAKFPDLYDLEEREETFEKLPHITMRFPGVTDLKADADDDAHGNAKATLILPLSCPIPRKESRYCDVANQVQSARASAALTEAVHSLAHGRAVRANDPEVLEYEAEARGVNSGFVMEGNLFARSTWLRFTLSALDARGMRTPDEEKRVNDQGLCMSHRVRNHKAASGEHVKDTKLHGCTLATEITWAALERNKRKFADAFDAAPTGLESVAAQCRKHAAENDREVMEDALENQFEV